uniref:Uncharacterized protein n=1 Tax=Arundo donax TaxID=35708 RepID=A0A0A9BAK5_ARUDO
MVPEGGAPGWPLVASRFLFWFGDDSSHINVAWMEFDLKVHGCSFYFFFSPASLNLF